MTNALATRKPGGLGRTAGAVGMPALIARAGGNAEKRLGFLAKTADFLH